jgi:prepilin-type N-terminal cleavage/methylation domain-containing protein
VQGVAFQSQIENRKSKIPRAFTMTEILIVIAIIVLVLALAVPALNFIGGSKSVEGATNSTSAMLARARNLAIGHQQVYGLFFYQDPATAVTTIAIVKDVGSSITPNVAVPPEVYLDLDSVNNDVLALPSGISVQFVDDGTNPITNQPSDRYIGYNITVHDVANGVVVPQTMNYGGVILFDADGRLVRKIYAFQISTGTAAGQYAWTSMGKLFEPASVINATPIPTVAEQDWVPGNATASKIGGVPERSQVGLVAFDHSSFINIGGTDADPILAGSAYTNSSEPAEEAWLDQNAALLLINRYNGTIVKSE